MSRTLGDRLRVLDGAGPPPPPDGPDVPRGSKADEDPRTRFPIDVRQPSMMRMTAIQWAAITANNDPPSWFTVGNRPVRITGGADGEPFGTQDLTMDMLRGISARTAYWHKHTERDGEQEQFPLEPVIRDMLADAHPPLPRLRRIVTAPVCGPDATISYQPGYREDTATYYAEQVTVPTPPDDPTAAEIAAARSLLLDEFLGDFPFISDAERAHALSLLLNPFLRDLVDGPTPLYLVEAPSAGTGKGLLAHMAMLPGLGSPPLLMPPATNEEETRKRLTAALVTLPEALLLDNISKGIDSPALAAALTSTIWTDRMLGRTETRSIPVRATWIATANNPSMSREIARRIVRIRLDAKAERPEERASFRHRRLTRWAADHRGELIGAALTLVQAWAAAGCPMSDHVLGSFDTWAQVHGGVLDVAGVPGFLDNRKESAGAVSGEDGAMAQLVPLWWEKHRDAVVKSGDLYEIAYTIDEFPMGRSGNDKGMKLSFGWTLSRFTDRVFGAYRIVYVDTATSGNHYRLEFTGADPP